MKKVLLIAAVAGLMTTACKKVYTCTCVETSEDPAYQSETYTYSSLVKMKKSDAETWCNASDESHTEHGINTYTVTYNHTTACDIK